MGGIGGYIAFPLYIGAALHDANNVQRDLIITQSIPIIQEMHSCAEDGKKWAALAKKALEMVHDHMGPEWPGPQGEYFAQIKALLPDFPGNEEKE